MSDPNPAEALNRLLRSARDSAEGFRQGAALARNPEFQSLFRERADERERLVDALEGEVRAFGAHPAQEGSILGEAHRLFTFVRDKVDRGSDKGLVEELVRREHLIAQSFEAVANDSRAPDSARRIAGDALKQMTDQGRELEDLSGEFH